MGQTLPTWAKSWPWSLDVVRKVIRQTPSLQALGQQYGAVRVYTASEAEVIRATVEKVRPMKCIA